MAKQSSSNARRAAEMLIMLSQSGSRGMTLGSMAEACGEARSSVHRTLTALADYGFVVQDGNRGNYRLGPAAYAIALRTPSVNEIVTTYQPALVEVTAMTNLSSYLMMRSGLDTICIASQSGAIYAQPYVSGVGGRIPLGVGVSGIVMLGMLERATRNRTMDMLEDKWAEWDITREGIESEVATYLKQGYCWGIRRSHGIESLTLTIPVANDRWAGLEVAMSILAPLSIIDQPIQAKTLEIMRTAIKTAEETFAVKI